VERTLAEASSASRLHPRLRAGMEAGASAGKFDAQLRRAARARGYENFTAISRPP